MKQELLKKIEEKTITVGVVAVSYTHLDVYKRQMENVVEKLRILQVFLSMQLRILPRQKVAL